MSLNGRIRALILSALVLLVGIIHFGVGVGIVSRYTKYSEILRQQVGLAGFCVFLGIFTVIIAVIALLAVLRELVVFGKISAILMFILGVFSFASLIAALALSGQTVGFIRDSMNDEMNKYASADDSQALVDAIQNYYQCCGVNLWLDWARIALSYSGGGIVSGRRRRQVPTSQSLLAQALRHRRQVVSSGGTVYNLPTSYNINLPLSCCKSGGTTSGNAAGGLCSFNSYNSTSSFYLGGCLPALANIGSSQLTGIAVINTCLTILAFVCAAKYFHMFFLGYSNPDGPVEKYPQSNQDMGQQQQVPQQYGQLPNNQYNAYNYNQNAYFNNNNPVYRMYM